MPLILAWPQAASAPQRTIERRVSTLDLGRTLLDLAQLEQLPFPGTNLLDAPQEADAPRYFLASGGDAAAILLRTGSWSCISKTIAAPASAPRHQRHQVELYAPGPGPHLPPRPVAQFTGEVRRLRGTLRDWLIAPRAAGVAAPPSASPVRRHELSARGCTSTRPANPSRPPSRTRTVPASAAAPTPAGTIHETEPPCSTALACAARPLSRADRGRPVPPPRSRLRRTSRSCACGR